MVLHLRREVYQLVPNAIPLEIPSQETFQTEVIQRRKIVRFVRLLTSVLLLGLHRLHPSEAQRGQFTKLRRVLRVHRDRVYYRSASLRLLTRHIAHVTRYSELPGVYHPDYIIYEYELVILLHDAHINAEKLSHNHCEGIRRCKEQMQSVNIVHFDHQVVRSCKNELFMPWNHRRLSVCCQNENYRP